MIASYISFRYLRTYLLLMLSGLCSWPSYAQSNPTTVSKDSLLAILARNEVPGASILTFSAESIDQEFYLGSADIAGDRPVTSETRFCTGSIAKSFVAAAVLKAHTAGILDVHQPLSELVPSLDYDNIWEANSPITLVHLLEHTSGFDDAHFDLEARANSRTPLAEIVALSTSSLHAQWKPGTANVYNNLGVIVVAHILESATGSDLATYLDRQIFSPLGLTSATYQPGGAQFATGYQNKDEVVPFPDVAQWPVGALSMTGVDLAHFVRMLLQGGSLHGKRVMRAAEVESMQRPESYLGASYGLTFGYGKGLIHTLEKSQHFIGHTGQYGGFASEFGYAEELNFGYVILLNSRDGSQAIKELKQAIIPEQHSAITASVPYVPAGDYLDSLTGGYQLTGSPLSLLHPFLRLADIQLLRSEEGQLVQRSMLGGDRVLEFVNKHVLKELHQPVGTGLIVAEVGQQVLRSDGTDYHRIGTGSAYLQFWLAAICTVSFVLALIVVPIQLLIAWLRRSPTAWPLLVVYLPFAVLALAVGQWLILYDTTVLYSPGAVLYLILSCVFGLAVLASVYFAVRYLVTLRFSVFLRIELLMLTLVSMTIFVYLFYWGLIGLRLWSY